MADFYNTTKRISQLYSRLQDDLSRDILETRVLFDIYPTVDKMNHLVQLSGLLSPEELVIRNGWRNEVTSLIQKGGELVLYGAGVRGNLIVKCLQNEGIKIAGFCDRKYKEFKNGYSNLPVFGPDDLFEFQDKYYVIITPGSYTSLFFREFERSRI